MSTIAAMGEDAFSMLEACVSDNPSSPLSARLAAMQLERGDAAAALRTVEAGLRGNSSHAVAHLIAARAHLALREYNDARRELNAVLALQPYCPAAEALLRQLPSIEHDAPAEPRVTRDLVSPAGLAAAAVRSHAQRSARRSRDEDAIPVPSLLRPGRGVQPNPDPSDAPTGVDGEHASLDEFRAEVSDLEQLAMRLEAARIPPLNEPEIPEHADTDVQDDGAIDLHSRPATETLAEIYERQGRYNEAKEIYLTLCARIPERAGEFITCIARLQRLIDSKTVS